MSNFYEILGVAKSADDADLRRAYRKGAIKWHPDKHAGETEEQQAEANARFKALAEAYEVLHDPKTRALYDRSGEEEEEEEKEEEGRSQRGYEGAGRFKFPKRGRAGSYEFKGNPNDVFARFFSGAFERERSFGDATRPLPTNISRRMEGASLRRESKPAVVELTLSLEELYRGATKKLRITRKSLTPGRQTGKIITVPVRPGYRAGTRLTYAGEGDELQLGVYQDVVVLLRERPHDQFVREGSDLHARVRICLADALCGCAVDVKTLDRAPRTLRINFRAPIAPTTTKVVPGEGMPRATKPGERGDLIVTFDIIFPTDALSPLAQEHIRKALGPRSSTSEGA